MDEASAFAQQFVVGLLGDRHGTGSRASASRNVQDLKMLYILMHRYIRAADDIERAGEGVYSPTLRDNAQDARNTLFNMLATVRKEKRTGQPRVARTPGRLNGEAAAVGGDPANGQSGG
jgi:hypothetical protein